MRFTAKSLAVAVIAAAAVTVTAPAANADRSNTLGGATTTNPFFSNLSDTIGYAGDVDYWKFRTTSNGYSRITLAGLPKDYALKLFNASGQMVAFAQRSGTAFEEIYKYLNAGTYYAQVYSPAKASSGTAYRLRFMPLTDGVKVLSSKSWKDSIGGTWIFGEVLNNTGATKPFVRMSVKFYNSSGGVVKSDSGGYADNNNMATRNRSTFSMVISDVPSTAVRYTLTPAWATYAPQQSVLNFVTKVTKQTISNGVFFNFQGNTTNKTGGYAEDITVENARYDKWGNITTTGSASVSRKRADGSTAYTLANGAVGTFSGGYYALPGTTWQLFRTTGVRTDSSGARKVPSGYTREQLDPKGELVASGLQDPGPTR